MGEIFSLKNQIQNYAWGSREILGRMRGVPVPTEQPEAEVWVGAHPAAPSRATVDGTESPLNELIVENPSRFLRPDRTSDWFPFLFKILAIDAPLSIQVHPTPEQAIAGFEDEQARGIAIDAPFRHRAEPDACAHRCTPRRTAQDPRRRIWRHLVGGACRAQPQAASDRDYPPASGDRLRRSTAPG